MSVQKRKFTKEEKQRIVKEAQSNGVTSTLDKYGVYPSTYYSWKKKLDTMGEKGLSHGMTPAHLKEIRRLEKENQLLKEIIAEKELESKLKDDLLKKKYPLTKRKNS